LLDSLAKYQEIELEDVEITFDELEIRIKPSMVPIQGMPPTITQKIAEYLESKYSVPLENYSGKVVEVTVGGTKSQGGSRSSSITIGGETSPAFYNFQSKTPHKPIIALDVFDYAKVPLSKAVKMHYREVLEDTAEWARLCVEKFDAEMINLHMTSIDPLIDNASPKKALKTVENVLQAVDVPIAIGGCGDPKKDLEVFEVLAEATEGERILFNSITLDMDIEKSAKIIKDYGHTVIAFTSMDVNRARELNRKLYDYLDKSQIIMDTTTAALGYGLDYAFTVMERSRLAGLKGDPELNHPISSGSTNAWAAREAWMKMGPEYEPRELRGPMWEMITAQTLLLAGVDYFMMMHPAAAREMKLLIDRMYKNRGKPQHVDWVTVTIPEGV